VINVVSLTLSVSVDLKKKMDKLGIINWSAVAREAIEEKIAVLEQMDKLLAHSKLTEEDAIILGRKVNKAVAKRYKELG
jgi:hypothetical protein